MTVSPKDILDFWLEAGPSKWWKKDASLDGSILERFGETHARAADGGFDHWEKEPESALALIIVLDQFSRNLYRNDPCAFAQDEKCLGVVKRLMASGDDRKLDLPLVQFAYLPLMHSENLDHQEKALAELRRLDLPLNVKAAIEHRDIIRDFGRFPHRNNILGRNTTPAEQKFLDDGGFKG